MKYFIPIIALFLCLGCSSNAKQRKSITIRKTDTTFVKVVKYEILQSIIKKQDNILYVVNFWASWCGPCVKELPDFMELNKMYSANKSFKMILVSLDNINEMESVLKPFIRKHQLEADNYLLDDNKRMNIWIPAIDSNWEGTIPATVIYRNGVKLFFREGIMEKSELDELIGKLL